MENYAKEQVSVVCVTCPQATRPPCTTTTSVFTPALTTNSAPMERTTLKPTTTRALPCEKKTFQFDLDKNHVGVNNLAGIGPDIGAAEEMRFNRTGQTETGR